MASIGFSSSSTGKKSDYSDIIGTMPSITEEQQAVSTPLQNYLTEAISGIEDYPTFDKWSETNVPDMFGGELGSQAMSAYSEALRGKPTDYPDYHTEFMTHIMPEIKESYVGTGAVTGTEYGDRVAREAGVWEERANRVRAELYNQAKQRQATAAMAYQQGWQAMLDTAYQNYINQHPDASTILQAALNYLNIPMMAAYQKPQPDTSIKWGAS